MPAFVTLLDAGNGTAELVLSPADGDAGIYELLVRGVSGACSRSDVIPVSVTVTEGVFNQPPIADAGANIKITNAVGWIALEGTVADDGLPTGTVDVLWEIVSGPPGAVLIDPDSPKAKLQVGARGSGSCASRPTTASSPPGTEVRVRVRQK